MSGFVRLDPPTRQVPTVNARVVRLRGCAHNHLHLKLPAVTKRDAGFAPDERIDVFVDDTRCLVKICASNEGRFRLHKANPIRFLLIPEALPFLSTAQPGEKIEVENLQVREGEVLFSLPEAIVETCK